QRQGGERLLPGGRRLHQGDDADHGQRRDSRSAAAATNTPYASSMLSVQILNLGTCVDCRTGRVKLQAAMVKCMQSQRSRKQKSKRRLQAGYVCTLTRNFFGRHTWKHRSTNATLGSTNGAV
uniref:Uncharacterized protein n=1 Tax=Oryza brachyantha TaxID=4533 RepID=J3KUM6_ORYBR